MHRYRPSHGRLPIGKPQVIKDTDLLTAPSPDQTITRPQYRGSPPISSQPHVLKHHNETKIYIPRCQLRSQTRQRNVPLMSSFRGPHPSIDRRTDVRPSLGLQHRQRADHNGDAHPQPLTVTPPSRAGLVGTTSTEARANEFASCFRRIKLLAGRARGVGTVTRRMVFARDSFRAW